MLFDDFDEETMNHQDTGQKLNFGKIDCSIYITFPLLIHPSKLFISLVSLFRGVT